MHCSDFFVAESVGVSQFKVHEYRLVFFWSLDLGVWSWESKLRRTGEREDGLSAIGTAADLMTSPHQLFLLLGFL